MTNSGDRPSTNPVTVESLAAAKMLPVEFLTDLGLVNAGGTVAIPYGPGARTRIRTSVSASGSRWQTGSKPIVPYGLFRAQTNDYRVIVEGESDAWALWHHGFPALGIPGASMVKHLKLPNLVGIDRIYVVSEPDAAGQQFPNSVANHIRRLFQHADEIGFDFAAPEVLSIHMPDGCKDPADLHLHLGADHDRFLIAFGEAMDRAVPVDSANSANTATEEWTPPVPLIDFDLPPFPTHVLTRWQREFVEAEAEATQTPTDLAAMLALAACALAVARSFEVEIKPGWREPLNIYVAPVLPSGERKSPVFREVIAPIEAEEARLTEKARTDIARAHTDRELLEDKRKEIKKKVQAGEAETDDLYNIDAEMEAHSIPIPPRLLVDDVTAEKLEILLGEHGGRIGLFAAEGDVFDIMAGRYHSGAMNIGVFLKAHPGDTIRVDRITRMGAYVEHPALTIGVAVQPDVIDGLAGRRDFRGRGLPARFLYAIPKSKIGRRKIDPPPLPEETRQAYQQRLSALFALGWNETGEYNPQTLSLTDDARQHLRDFEAELEPRLAPGAELGGISDWAGKLVGATARIAAILHLTEQDNDVVSLEIDATTVDRAIKVAHYLIPHAQAAFALMGADPATSDARYILAVISERKWNEFSRRDLSEATKGRFKTVENMKPGLFKLIEHDYIRELELPYRDGPGRKPSPRFVVNPHNASHNAHNSQNHTGDQ